MQRTAVLDPAGMEEYQRGVRPLLVKYGAIARAAGSAVVAEGEWTPERLVILEYARMQVLRQRVARWRTNLVFVEGP